MNQLICQNIYYPKLEEANILHITERGDGWFGSTRKINMEHSGQGKCFSRTCHKISAKNYSIVTRLASGFLRSRVFKFMFINISVINYILSGK